MNLNSIRAFFAKGNRAKWLVFTLFCMVLFIKTMIFHNSVGFEFKHLIPGHIIAFFVFWSAKLAPILFLGSFVFIAKRQWWTIIVNVIIDLWAIANLFYFKANNLFLSVEMVMMADNLDGFWDSLYSYMGWDIYSFILLTISYIIITIPIMVMHTGKRNILFFFIIIAMSLIAECGINAYQQIKLNTSNRIDQTKKNKLGRKYMHFYPFGCVTHYAVRETWADYEIWASRYILGQSVISFLPGSILYYTLSPSHEIVELDDVNLEEIELFVGNNECENDINPKTNVVFVLFESLESWPLYDDVKFNYLPNIKKLSKQKHVLYCDKLISQTKYGISADGQMIGATGLLPINNGATCKYYGHNEFPNYAHFFKNSTIINPAPNIWQQNVVTYSYQFQELIEPTTSKEYWEGDAGVMETVTNYVFSVDSAFCALGITVETHSPFAKGSSNPVHVEKDMPPVMSAYLNSLHYTDSCIGKLLDTIFNSHLADNTTIVVTGDHTIFRNETAFKDMTEYAEKNGIDFRVGHTFTPLIIYSPEIEGNIHVTDTCYQMDVFPTILNLIGAEDYFWHGFGVNVMDSVARHNRPITEEEAYRLSDLMIRSDYFRNYYNPVDSAGNDR